MLALAWRNLWRQGRRSLITLSAVAIVVFMAIMIYSLGGAIKNSLYQDLTEQVGHIQIHAADYRDARDFSAGLLYNATDLRASVEKVAPDAVVVGSLQIPALLAGEDRSRGLAISGQDWPDILREDFVADNLAEGNFIAADDLTSIMLGQSLATSLKVNLGDEVYVYAPETEGYGAAAYTLRGLLDFDDPNQEINAVYVSLAAAQELAAPNAVSRLELHYPTIVTVDQDTLTHEDANSLSKSLGQNYEIEVWQELDPGLAGVLNFIMPIMMVMSLIFFLLAGLLVLNTVYLSTLERIREFGVIISLGALGRQVMQMITLESVIMCVTGAAIGTTLGLGLIAMLSDGFTYPGMEKLFAEVGMNPIMYPTIELWQVLFAVGFAIVTAILAALWPALLAANIEPAEAMRYTA